MKGYALEKPRPVLAPYSKSSTRLAQLSGGIIGLSAIAAAGIVYGFYFAVLPLFFLVYLLVPIAIMALMAIWMLPDHGTAPTGLMTALFLLFFVALSIWPNYLSLDFGGLPWISLRRLIMVPLALIFVVSLSISRNLRKTTANSLNSAGPLWKMMVVLLITGFFSTALTLSVGTMNIYLNRVIFSLFPFLLAAFVFVEEKNDRKFSRDFIVCALIVGVIGLIEFHKQRILWVGYIPSFLAINDPSVLATLGGNVRMYASYRPSSTFGGPLQFGEFLALATPFAIHLMMSSARIERQVLGAVVSFILLVAAIYSGARLALVGTLVAYATYGFQWAVRRWRLKTTDLVGPAVTLTYPALLCAMGIAVVSVGRVRNAVLGNGATEASDASRDRQWEQLLPTLQSSPVFGHGAGTSATHVGVTLPSGVWTVDSHYLTILSDYGLLGFAAYYGMIVYGILKSAQIALFSRDRGLAYAMPLASALSVFLIVKYVLSQEDNDAILYILLGMVCAFAYRARKTENLPPLSHFFRIGQRQ